MDVSRFIAHFFTQFEYLRNSVGIVIIAVASLLVCPPPKFPHTHKSLLFLAQISFCGYKVLNWYERLAWIPVFIIFIIILGVGGKHLTNPPPAEPATATTILSFASTVAGFVITYAPLSSDFTSYFKHDVSRFVHAQYLSPCISCALSWKIFWYSFAGFVLPIVRVNHEYSPRSIDPSLSARSLSNVSAQRWP